MCPTCRRTGSLLLPLLIMPVLTGRVEAQAPVELAAASAGPAAGSAFRPPSLRPEQASALAELERMVPDLEVTWNPLGSTPSSLSATRGLLPFPEGSEEASPILGFLSEFRALYLIGPDDLSTLELQRSVEFENPRPGDHVSRSRYEYYSQTYRGLPVMGASLAAAWIEGEGILAINGRVVPDIASAVAAEVPELTSLQAVSAAAHRLGLAPETVEGHLTSEPGPPGEWVVHAGDAFSEPVTTRLVYYPVGDAELTLAWEVVARPSTLRRSFMIVIHAQDGSVLTQVDYKDEITDPEWLVFARILGPSHLGDARHVVPLTSPYPLSHARTSSGASMWTLSKKWQGTRRPALLFVGNGDPVASPRGWLAAGATGTWGNNAIAFFDRSNDAKPQAHETAHARVRAEAGRAVRSFRFEYDWSRAPSSSVNRDAALTQAFFVANWFHDRMYRLGFGEEAGNHQEVNYSGLGLGGDPVWIELQRPSWIPGAHYEPDGKCCFRVEMVVPAGPPTPDAALDAQTLVHELAHGVTNRIAGGPAAKGFSGTVQSEALGEGYSDWFALALLTDLTEDPALPQAIGRWFGRDWKNGQDLFRRQPFAVTFDESYYWGIRRFPYSTDRSISPLTYADIDPDQFDVGNVPSSPWWTAWEAYRRGLGVAINGPDYPHHAGEVWASALWDARAALIDAHGPSAGNELALTLVVRSLFLLPKDTPDFVMARTAVLRADRDVTGGQNLCTLYRAFAARGLGRGAIVPDKGRGKGVVESRAVPNACQQP